MRAWPNAFEPPSFGLGAKALHVRRGSELSGEDHLQGHRPVQANLPGAIDHAHAAAGDLLQQFVIAEVMQDRARRLDRFAGRQGRWFRVGSKRLGQVLNLVMVREERSQLGGQVGMTGEQVLPVRRLAGFDRLDIGGNDRIHSLAAGLVRLIAHRSLLGLQPHV
jgi:hypothetical protein